MKSRSRVTKGVRLLSPSARARLPSSFNSPQSLYRHCFVRQREKRRPREDLSGKTFSLKTKLLSHFGVFKSGRSWAFGVVGGAKERRKGV
jgi:hypothetical protein